MGNSVSRYSSASFCLGSQIPIVPSSDPDTSSSWPRLLMSRALIISSWPTCLRTRWPVSTSQLPSVMSADAEKSARESRAHWRSRTAPR